MAGFRFDSIETKRVVDYRAVGRGIARQGLDSSNKTWNFALPGDDNYPDPWVIEKVRFHLLHEAGCWRVREINLTCSPVDDQTSGRPIKHQTIGPVNNEFKMPFWLAQLAAAAVQEAQ